jgi:hypothetical protein
MLTCMLYINIFLSSTPLDSLMQSLSQPSQQLISVYNFGLLAYSRPSSKYRLNSLRPVFDTIKKRKMYLENCD